MRNVDESKPPRLFTAPARTINELVALIDPSAWDAYSANLVRWLKAHGRDGDEIYSVFPGAGLAEIYGPGALFLGQPFSDNHADTDFSGVLLMGALTFGRDAKRFCHAGKTTQLRPLEGFWQKYIDQGRCAIDPEHRVMFKENNRIIESHGARVCAWCSSEVR